MDKLNFVKLQFTGKEWTEESQQIICDMLEVWDSSHTIVVCHPNHIFKDKPISKENAELTCIDWQNLKTQFDFTQNDSFCNFLPAANDAFKYIHRRFRHELFNSTNTPEPRYLAVIENDNMGGCLVRGIFKATKQSIMVAENPLYSLYKPTSSWDKSLRLTADDTRSIKEFINSYNNQKI